MGHQPDNNVVVGENNLGQRDLVLPGAGKELLETRIVRAQFCGAPVVFCVAICGDRLFSRGYLSLPGSCVADSMTLQELA